MTSVNSANPNSQKLEKAEEVWQRVRSKVVSWLFGPNVTAVPYLENTHLFRPLCVIGKRVDCCLRVGKIRTLSHLGPHCDLLGDPSNFAMTCDKSSSPQREGAVYCEFFYKEFLDGVGHVRVQVTDFYKESQVLPMASRQELLLKDSLPWLYPLAFTCLRIYVTLWPGSCEGSYLHPRTQRAATPQPITTSC